MHMIPLCPRGWDQSLETCDLAHAQLQFDSIPRRQKSGEDTWEQFLVNYSLYSSVLRLMSQESLGNDWSKSM